MALEAKVFSIQKAFTCPQSRGVQAGVSFFQLGGPEVENFRNPLHFKALQFQYFKRPACF